MSDDPKHTITDLLDLVTGVIALLQGALTGVVATEDVVLAFKDERADAVDGETRTFPRATVYMHQPSRATDRAYGGVRRIEVRNPAPNDNTATISAKPIPIDIRFQIDTYALTPEQHWAVMSVMMPLLDLQRPPKVTTPAGREVFLTTESWDSLDSITADNWYRISWRVRAEIWMPSPEATQQAYIVLQRKLGMGGQSWVMDPAP